uniref:Uncharacterized protein n=1 Tax=Dunaliella tertiolecta TaxID=3047 RepID=A0A7S3R862_DUNTE
MGDVVVRHSFTPALLNPPVLAAGVASLGSLHREWGLRIAQELALTFGRAAVGYKEAVESADSYPTHTGAAGTVTPILEPAMAQLQARLHALAPSLDGPSFRDIWRAVTVPVNRFLFNYVATEAFFSQAGAHQFAVDCAGMVAVFSPFTKRPAAHFREMLAAARLLTLGDQDTQEVVRKASMQAAVGEPLWREPWLAQLGVGCLSAQQVIAVVERRL